MSEFYVRIPDLDSVMDSSETLLCILEQTSAGVLAVRRNLSMEVRSRARLDSRLNMASEELSRQGQSLSRVVETGRAVSRLYRDTEEGLISVCGNPGGLQTDETQASAEYGQALPDGKSDAEESENIISKIIKAISELVGQAGFIGGGIGTVISLFTGDTVDTLKGFANFIGQGAETVANCTDISWKELLGWYTSPNLSGNLLENMKSEVGKYAVSGKNSAAQNIGAIAGWANVALTAGERLFKNLDEYDGDWSSGEMWAETAIETVLDIGKGALVTVGVTTIIGLLAPAAPAVLVGLAVTAVGIAVDWALDSLCGGDWLDAAAKGIIKFSSTLNDCSNAAFDALAEEGKKLVNWAGEGVQKAADSVCEWVSGLFQKESPVPVQSPTYPGSSRLR